jgi:hypothetical protein
MFSNSKSVRHAVAAIVTGLSVFTALPAFAQDASAMAETAYKEVEAALGGVPGFIRMYPRPALRAPGPCSATLCWARPHSTPRPKH